MVAQDTRCAIGPDGQRFVSWTEADYNNLPQVTSSIYYNFNRDGFGFQAAGSAVLLVSQPPNQAIAAQPSQGFPGHDLAIVPAGTNKGRVVFVYEELAPSSGFNPAHKTVVSVYTDDYGVTQSVPETIHPTFGPDQWLPRISADLVTGRMYATWYDGRSDDFSYVLGERFLAVSDDGATWGDWRLLSPGTSNATPATYDYGDLGGSAAVHHDIVIAGWADNSTSGTEMEALIRLVQWTAGAMP